MERCGDSLWMKDGDNTEILAKELGPIAFREPVWEIILLSALYTFVAVEQGCYTCLELRCKLYVIYLEECKTSAKLGFSVTFVVKDEVQKVELWRSKGGKAWDSNSGRKRSCW